MSEDIKVWFSAGELSLLGERFVAGIPTTMRGCTRMAQRKEWISREMPCKGGKGGIRTEYQPPAPVLELIRKFLSENPEFFSKKSKSRSTDTELIKHAEDIGGDESARQAAALLDPQPEDRLRMLQMVLRMSEMQLTTPPTPEVARKVIVLADAWSPFATKFPDLKERLDVLKATAALFV